MIEIFNKEFGEEKNTKPQMKNMAFNEVKISSKTLSHFWRNTYKTEIFWYVTGA